MLTSRIQQEFFCKLELRHQAFVHSRPCGEGHILDGSLSMQELLTSDISEIAAIRDSNRVKDRVQFRRPCSLRFDPSQCDWGIKMRIARIIWGPLPRLFAQTLGCQYLVTPDQTTCTLPKVRNQPGDIWSQQNEVPKPKKI